MRRTRVVAGLFCAIAAAAVLAAPVLKAGSEPINYVDINKIKAEGLQRSQVMDLASWLTDVYAPRLTGSPMSQKAAEWTVAKLKEYGLVNVKIEPWVNRNGFERGWTNDKFYLAAVAPEKFPIPGTPTAWTPGTEGLVSGEVVLVTATTEADLAAYKGKLQGQVGADAGRARRGGLLEAAGHALHRPRNWRRSRPGRPRSRSSA
ncbi:MAG: hypothetical protein MZW92_24910 [Comamonadaceae bacterium]|nr:hypothetical protein [Comamonadaceae bacterium]